MNKMPVSSKNKQYYYEEEIKEVKKDEKTKEINKGEGEQQ